MPLIILNQLKMQVASLARGEKSKWHNVTLVTFKDEKTTVDLEVMTSDYPIAQNETFYLTMVAMPEMNELDEKENQVENYLHSIRDKYEYITHGFLVHTNTQSNKLLGSCHGLLFEVTTSFPLTDEYKKYTPIAFLLTRFS